MQSKHMCSGTDMSPSVARFEMVFTFNSSRENKISNPTFVLTFFFCNDIVRFLGKTRLHKVFQASSRSWTICRSTNWSLCLCWMDLWVRISFCACKVSNFTKYLTSVTYKKTPCVLTRGYPVWLHKLPGIQLRTDKQIYKVMTLLNLSHNLFMFLHTLFVLQ